MNRVQKTIHFFVSLPLLLAISTSVSAQGPGGGFSATTPLQSDSQYSINVPKAAPAVQSRTRRTASGEPLVSVIVKLSDDALANYKGGIAGLPATSPAVTGADQLDVNTPQSKLY